MSAQMSGSPLRRRRTAGEDAPATEPVTGTTPRTLRSAPPPAPRISRFPFVLIVMGIFGVGMAGLLMLNTTLQNQAFESRTLQRQATELTYRQSDLEDQLAKLAAPQELARRASDLGLRPNPYPAVLVLPKGKVKGLPTPVVGNEVPYLIVKSPAQIKAEKAAKKKAEAKAAAKKKAKAKAAAKRKAAEAKAAKKAAKAKAAAKKGGGRH